jgi:hypothetical protein
MPLAWKLAFQHGESLSHNSRTNTGTADLGLGVLALPVLPILHLMVSTSDAIMGHLN